jgi:hypothetical protein
MFKRLIVENWAQIASLLSFGLIFFVFVTSAARAMLLPKAKVKHMASLPLEDDDKDRPS